MCTAIVMDTQSHHDVNECPYIALELNLHMASDFDDILIL